MIRMSSSYYTFVDINDETAGTETKGFVCDKHFYFRHSSDCGTMMTMMGSPCQAHKNYEYILVTLLGEIAREPCPGN